MTEPDDVVLERPGHCAKFSTEVLAGITRLVDRLDPDHEWTILDPFAGIGLIHTIAAGRTTVASELEPEWAAQGADHAPRNAVARAEFLPFADGSVDAIITSPSYGNRMCDTYDGKGVCHKCNGHPADLFGGECDRCGGAGHDTSKRYTYTTALGRRLTWGSAAGLQWGPEYRRLHRLAWKDATRVLRPAGWFILNISDHLRQNSRGDQVRIPVSRWHHDHLTTQLGYEAVTVVDIKTHRNGNGANHDARVQTEHLVLFRAPR
jgi:tRNA G10  N-methylase Trm11